MCIKMSQDVAVLNKIMKLLVLYKAQNFLTSLLTVILIDFSHEIT